MKERFEGDHNRDRLVEVIARAALLARAEAAVEDVVRACTLQDLAASEPLMTQGDYSSDIYIVLSGQFEVLVNGRVVAARGPSQHLGEMALIDPTAPRSATVRAATPATVARLSEDQFTKIADKFPRIWRNVGDSLAKRLRERGECLREPNPEPRIFIGSSAEAISIARALQVNLERDGVVIPWTDDVFKAGRTSIETLVREAGRADFALFAMTPDDYLEMRKRVYAAMRDNVLFEFGLFLGSIGRERCFAVMPRRADLHLPSDLLGVTIWDFEPRKGEDLIPSVAPVATKFRAEIERLKSR